MGTVNVDVCGKGSNWLWSTWVQLMLMHMVKGLTVVVYMGTANVDAYGKGSNCCGLHGHS